MSARDEAQLPLPILVGDIGGTNARFAIVEGEAGAKTDFPGVRTAAYLTIDEAIETVLEASPVRPKAALLAVAGPVDGDEIPLTNCDWVVRPAAMARRLDLEAVVVLNDFEAQAMAAVALGPDHLVQIGGGSPEAGAGRTVLGPGTGCGVAGLVHSRGAWIPVPGEGGHVDIGPRSARDHQIWAHLEPIEGRISAEQMLCGRGLVNIYRAIAAADGRPVRLTDPAEVTAAAEAGADPVATEAVALFATCLGRLAGDMALIFMSRGGVYLSGGIAQKIVPVLKSGGFRAAFDDKAPHGALMRTMPVYVMTHPTAAIEGMAAFARDPGLFLIETAGRRWSPAA